MWGENREVQFLCNDFSVDILDFYLVDFGGVNGEVRKFQGNPGDPANNCFTRPLIAADIFTEPAKTESFIYYRPPGDACKDPFTSGNYVEENTEEIECVPIFEAEGDFEDYLTLRDQVLSFDFETGEEVDYYQLRFQKERHFIALLKAYLSAKDYGEAFNLLDLEGTFSAKLMKYGLQVDLGLFSEAARTLSAFPDTLPEMPTFKAVQQLSLNLYENLDFTLSQNDSTFLDSVARSEMGIRAYARGLLHLLEEVRVHESVSLGAPRLAGSGGNKVTEERLMVYPNPASRRLTVTTHNVQAGTMIKVVSLMGRQVFSAKLTQANQTLKVPIGDWPSGIYVLSLLDAQGNSLEQKKVSVIR
jgi:glutaredoxin-related protein